jgi:hypothetical protein
MKCVYFKTKWESVSFSIRTLPYYINKFALNIPYVGLALLGGWSVDELGII